MSEFGREGRTVVFVSHDLGSITQLCRRAIWLDHGQIQADGPSEEVVQRYVRGSIGDVPRADFTPDPTQRVQVLAAEVADENGRALDHPERGEPLTLRVRFVVREPLPVVAIGLSVQNQRGIRVLDEVWGEYGDDVLAIDDPPTEIAVALTVPPILPAGDYVLGVWIGSSYDSFLEQEVLRFRVWPRADDPADALERDRIVQPPVALGRPARGRAMSEAPRPSPSPSSSRRSVASSLFARCLESLARSAPAAAEILVVDQSHDPAVAALVAELAGERASASSGATASASRAHATTGCGRRCTTSSS